MRDEQREIIPDDAFPFIIPPMAGKTRLNEIRQPYLWIAFGVLCGLIGAALILLLTGPSRGQAIELLPAPTPPAITVHVSGAVAQPGVYELDYGSRAQDAIETAGGATVDANLNALNLARRLNDGDQVHLPAIGEAGTSAAAFPLNINIATLDELSQLPGIGPVTAQAIIDYRQSHGAFEDPAEIQNVAGIGPATFESIEDLITTGQ